MLGSGQDRGAKGGDKVGCWGAGRTGVLGEGIRKSIRNDSHWDWKGRLPGEGERSL